MTLGSLPCPVCGVPLGLDCTAGLRVTLDPAAVEHLAGHHPPDGDGGEPCPLPVAA